MHVPVKLPAKLTRAAGKLFLKLRNVSPELFVVCGIALGTAAVVTVGVKTWKHKEEMAEDISEIKKCNKPKEIEATEETSECDDESTDIPEAVAENTENDEVLVPDVVWKDEHERKKFKLIKIMRFGKHLVKIYWLPVTFGIASIILIWGGRTILRKDLSAATAAYAALLESYRKYRKRVIDEFGVEKDQEFQYGVKMVEGTNADGETVQVASYNAKDNVSQYAFVFNEGEWNDELCEWFWKNYEWSRDKHINIRRIRDIQDWANNQLVIRGWVSLGEVAEKLGSIPNPYWYRVGWIWTKEKQAKGENFVELGVLESKYQLPVNKLFMDLRNPQNFAVIEPNVDGCIDCVFDNPEKYDRRCGKRSNKHKRIPSLSQMFGDDYAEKLLSNGGAY